VTRDASQIPVWLLDVDGVVNAASEKPNTAAWSAAEWCAGDAVVRGRTMRILWAQPVVDFIRLVHESARAEVRWHSTWQHDVRALEELVGLPRLTVAVAPEFASRDSTPEWWKLAAAERVVRCERRALVWADDDLAYSGIGSGLDGVKARLMPHAPVLLVCPSSGTGLTARDLDSVNGFLNLYAPAYRAWMVVETRYSRTGQVERTVHHTRIGSTPMSERDAKGYAGSSTARHANAPERRTFRAEPASGAATAATPATDGGTS
jgi:hypothetical protein